MKIKDEAHRKRLKDKFIGSAMASIDAVIVTTQEVVDSIRKTAIYNWGDEAKEKLKSIGIVTDRDVWEHMKIKYAEWEVEDPYDIYLDIDIIPDPDPQDQG